LSPAASFPLAITVSHLKYLAWALGPVAMADVKILVWRYREPAEGAEPDVEVKVPAALARWIPKMMAFVPKKQREETWGADADFSMFTDIEKMINELPESGVKEIMDVKTKDSRIKVLVER